MPDEFEQFLKQRHSTVDPNSQRQAIEQGASELGINPVDYATAMSYESGGTFDPWQRGPVTKWGQHRGTIQYGEPQQKQYGVFPGQSFEDQVTRSNVQYLKDKGVQPGMGFDQIYAAINGGSVKKNLATQDANTGRSIADNIRLAQRDHRNKVLQRFWGGQEPLDDFAKFQQDQKPDDFQQFLAERPNIPQDIPQDIPQQPAPVAPVMTPPQAVLPPETTQIEGMAPIEAPSAYPTGQVAPQSVAPQSVAQPVQNVASQGTQATAPPQKLNFATSEPTISDVNYDDKGNVIPDLTQQSNLRNAQVSAKDAGSTVADAIDIPDNIKTLEGANKYVASQLKAKYGNVNIPKNFTISDWQPGRGATVDFNTLKSIGVDTDAILAQKVAENRVENPELAKIHLDRAVPNAKELGEKVKEATRIPLFGYSDAPSGLFGGLVQNVGDFGGMLAGSIKASPSYGAINEILSNGGTRPVKAVDPTAEALMDFYDSANAFSEATGAKDADGKDTIPTILFKGIGQTPEYAMMSALPGGLVTGIPLKNSLLARAKDKPWNEVVKETGWGVGEGALFTFLPKGVQKLFGVDTSLLKTIGRIGTEVAGISGGTYGMETLKNPDATPEDKLKSAISIGLFHLYGATHGSLKGDVAHVVDAKNNLDAYVKIEGPDKFTFVEKQKPDLELAIPKPADKLSEDFASQPEKGFQITGGKSDNPAIVSPEENAAKLAKKATENAPETSANSSSESTASQEAINRLESEKNAGLTRVVVDTRSKTERPLIGVDAVDYTPKPHESVEYRGGGRNGEVIAQGDKVSPAYSPPERDVATKTEAKPETKTAEPDVYEINADELANEKPQIRQTGSAETFVGASATGNNQSQNNITPEYAQQRGVTITSTSDHPQKDLMARSPETFFKNGRQDGYYIQDFDNGRRLFNPTTGEIITFEASDKKNGTSLQTAKIFAANYAQENPVIERDIPAGEIKRTAIFNKPIEIKEGSTVYNASGKEGEVVGKDGDNLLVQWTKPNGEMDGEPVPVRPDKVSTTKAEKVAEKPVETKVTEPKAEPSTGFTEGSKFTNVTTGKEGELYHDPKLGWRLKTGENSSTTFPNKFWSSQDHIAKTDEILASDKSPIEQAKEIVANEKPVSTQSNSTNKGTTQSRPNSENSTSNKSAETTPIKRPSEELPTEVNAKGVTAESPVKEGGNDGGKSSESATGGEKPSAKASEVPEALKVFEKNKIFTPDAVAKARERLAKKGTQFNAGLDPETLHDLGVIGGAYIEAGARNFGEFASKMKADIKGISDDVLKQVYELVHKNYGDKIPNLEPPEGAKEVKQGERGSSKIGKSIEQKAIEQGLTDGFPETAGYDKKYRDDQIQRVEKVITQDYDAARRMALGLEPIPHEVSPVMLLRGMEEVAKARKDVQLQYELANSPLVSETSRHAQEMRFMQEREQDSAMTALQAIRRERIAQTQRILKGRTVEEAIKQEAERLASTMKRSVEHVKRQIKTKGAWDAFLDSIEC